MVTIRTLWRLSRGFFVVVALLTGGLPLRAQVILSEIQVDPAGSDFGKQWVELQNTSAASVDIGGHWLSFPPAAYRVPDGVELPPGGTIVVHLNRGGDNTDTDLFTGIAGIRNLRVSDSIGLFSENLFGDPDSILDFVQWSTVAGLGQEGEDVAAAAGIWSLGDVIDSTIYRPGCTISYDGAGDGAADWCVDGTPNRGEENDGCGFPRIVSSFVINEIGEVGGGSPHTIVEIVHRGEAPESLDGYWLVSGDSTYQFPASPIRENGDMVLVHLGIDGPIDTSNYYTGSGFSDVDLEAPTAVALYGNGAFDDATWMIDFVQWLEGGQPREAQAVEAELWTAGQAVDFSGRIEDGTVMRRPQGSGPEGWRVDNTPSLGAPNDQPPETELVINELLPAPIGDGNQAIELFNRGLSVIDLGNLALCAEPRQEGEDAVCYEFPEGTALPDGEYLVVWLADGVDDGSNVYTGPFVELGPDDALALLITPDATNPGNYLDYVRWGAATTVLEAAAVEAQIWEAGDTVDVSELGAGISVAYLGTGRGSPRYLLDDSPTIGEENDILAEVGIFSRGDCNGDGSEDVTDPINLLQFQFLGSFAPDCDDGCDFNDDGDLDVTDAINMLGNQFLGQAPAEPPKDCGPDPTPDDMLDCVSFPPCF